MTPVPLAVATFLEEYRKLLLDAGIKFDEKYFP
jgi:hypothetical protein